MESMNDSNFESMLKKHSFKEKASKSLLRQLQNEATWSKPWYRRFGPAISALILLLIILLIVLSGEPKSSPKETSEPSEIKLVQPMEQVIADIRYGSNLAHEFRLNFPDSPQTILEARYELAKKIESRDL